MGGREEQSYEHPLKIGLPAEALLGQTDSGRCFTSARGGKGASRIACALVDRFLEKLDLGAQSGLLRTSIAPLATEISLLLDFRS